MSDSGGKGGGEGQFAQWELAPV